MFYEVIPGKALGGVLTYEYVDDSLPVGTVVEVPLGRTRVAGVVVKKVVQPNFPTKKISRIIYAKPLPRHLLLAIKFIAEYYGAPTGSVASMVLPTGILAQRKTGVKKSSEQTRMEEVQVIDRGVTGAETERKLGVRLEVEAKNRTKPNKTEQVAKMAEAFKIAEKLGIPLNVGQKNALQGLQQAPGATKLLFGVTGSGKTNVYLTETARVLSGEKSVVVLVPEIALTSQLVRVFREKLGERVVLIHSQQKATERRRIFEELLSAEEAKVVIGPRSALFAPVAELGLIVVDEEHEGAYYQENAPRYAAVRVASYLAQKLAIPCILGSATPNVVDYYLAKQRGTLVKLEGKAKEVREETRSEKSEEIEDGKKAEGGGLKLDGIKDEGTEKARDKKPKEAGGGGAEIKLVDLKDREAFARNRYFSNALIAAMKRNLEAGHQTLIFHNRRGSAPLTICDVCGEEIMCPECFLPLTLHADTYELVCHTCGFRRPMPAVCPKCGAPGLVHKGFGTKLLENELRGLFPRAKIRRFDADNKRGESLAETYDAVREGEVEILVGTQTVAKGLDLPRLATVGVVQADAGLDLPCFSAEERTFQLLTQVIGRVGRGHLDFGEVIIQTFRPEHPMLAFALREDYEGFAQYLLAKRRAAGFPPFRFVAQVSCTLKTERLVIAKVRELAKRLTERAERETKCLTKREMGRLAEREGEGSAIRKREGLARRKEGDLLVSPPMPAFHERTSRGYTWQVVVRSRSRAKLVEALTGLDKSFRVTFDPPSLL